MDRKLLECVPNFSEGRDAKIIEKIVNEVKTTKGVTLLNVDPGKATNRTVVTFVGNPDSVIEAAFKLIKKSSELIDMEMVQFHPSGMVLPEEIEGTLVTEAVRGEGGKLINNKGERFMKEYDPKRMELSTRDRVAIANYTEIIEGRGTKNGVVFLDISHKSKEFIIEKLPSIYRQFLEAQMLDISKSPMEVAPTAHYSMGGILVNPEDLSTPVEGLFAAGEVAGGLHGANRLGGNSLAEIIILTVHPCPTTSKTS